MADEIEDAKVAAVEFALTKRYGRKPTEGELQGFIFGSKKSREWLWDKEQNAQVRSN